MYSGPSDLAGKESRTMKGMSRSVPLLASARKRANDGLGLLQIILAWKARI